MKAIQILAPGHIEFVDVPQPELKPGHALIRTHRLSLCGSDIFVLLYAQPESYPQPPGASGHEMIGLVEAVGEGETAVRPGDYALVLAPEQQAMCEYYLAPFHNILPLPPGKPLEHLLQAQQLGTVIYSCKTLPNVIGKDVAVIGQGSAGLWFNFMLRRLGAKRIIGVDLQAHRLQIAPLYGATHTIHNRHVDPVTALAEITNGRMADIVIEAAGEIDSINLTIDLIKDHGHILQFGVPHAAQIPVNYSDFFRKCLSLKANVYAIREPDHTSTRMALDLIAQGDINVGPVITHRFPFEQVRQAYELQHTYDEGAIKIVIDMPE